MVRGECLIELSGGAGERGSGGASGQDHPGEVLHLFLTRTGAFGVELSSNIKHHGPGGEHSIKLRQLVMRTNKCSLTSSSRRERAEVVKVAGWASTATLTFLS